MLKTRIFAISLILVCALLIGIKLFGPGLVEQQLNQVEDHQSYSVSKQAQTLHQRLTIGDWHADSLLWGRDLAKHNDTGHVDIPRLQQGNVALQVFTTVTKSPEGLNYEHNLADAPDSIFKLALLQTWPIDTWHSLTQRALHQGDQLLSLTAKYPQDIMMIRSQQELAKWMTGRAANPKLIGALLGTEGSHALDGNLDNIDVLYEKGFRVMSLQHFFDNKLGGSLHGASDQGLSEFGRQAVEKMQQMNIIVDLSHSSNQTVRDVLAITQRPVIISHTGFKGHCNTKRNLDDELMKSVAKTDGLIAVGFWQEAACGIQPSDIAEAIAYGIQLVGEDRIALGSDYDGAVKTGFDVSELSALTEALLQQGLTETQIFKVMGGNMLLFLQDNLPAN